MVAYYASLLVKVPKVLWEATDRALTVVSVLLIVAALSSREWASALADWEGVSPWWALALIGLLTLWGLLRANFDTVRDLRSTAGTRQATEQELRVKTQLAEVQAERIGQLEKAYAVSQAQYKVFQDFDREFRR